MKDDYNPKIDLEWSGKSLDDMVAEERTQTVREMRDVRNRLGQFTLRFMMEAIYGDEYTRQVLGEDGGQVLMRDIQVETTAENGGLRTTINEKQLKRIMREAHGDRTPEEIKESDAKAKKLMKELNEFSPEERETIMKFIKKIGDE